MASVAEFAEALLPFVRKNQRAIVKRIRRILWRSSVPVLGTDDPDAEEEEEDSTTSTTVDVSPRHLTAAAPLPKIRAKPAREVAWLPTLTGGDVVPFIGGGGEEEPAASTSRAGTTTGRGRKHARSGVLRIALVPNRDRPVIDELSEVAGKSWNFRVCDDYESLLEALRTDAVDLAWLPPVVYVHAASVGLARLMLTLERKGLATYNSAIVVRNDSEARDISYVIGRRFAWVDQWSASGYLAPRQMLRSAGIDPDTAFRAQGFARSFPGVVTAITTDVADAGALHCSVDDQGDIVSSAWKPRDGLRAIAVSEAIPGDTICVPAMRPTEESQILAERLLELASSARVARAFLRVFGTNRLVAGNAERYASLKSAFGADLHARRGR